MGMRRAGTGPSEEFPEGAVEHYLRLFLERRATHATPWEETDFPPLDIYETPEELIVEAELPGVEPASIEVSVSAGTLVIEGLKEECVEGERVNFLCMERGFGAYRRIVPLVQAVDVARIRARCAAGVLQVRIPKVEEKRGQRRVVPVAAEEPPSP